MNGHQSVQQRIKQIASHFTECEYCFASLYQLNKVLDEVEVGKPTICYILPPSGKLGIKYGGTTFVDKPLTMIAFVISTDFDIDGEANDVFVERMKDLAIRFIREVNRSGLFEGLDNIDIEYRIPRESQDENSTGIIIELPLEENRRVSCTMSNDFGYVENIEEDGENEDV